MPRQVARKVINSVSAKPKADSSRTKLTSISGRMKKRLKKPGANMTEALITSLGEGLLILDEYGHISQINQPALDMLGFERRELEGAFGPKLVTIKDRQGKVIPTPERPAFRALLTGKVISEIVYVVRKNGSEFPMAITATPFVVRGKPKGVVMLYRDVSQELQIERAKDEFVSLASHQLRGPLTAIRLFSELLSTSAKDKLTPRELNYIKRIHFSTEKMLDLVTDFLNISRIELGQLRIRAEPTLLSELIETRVEEMRPVALANGVKLTYSNYLKSPKEVPIDKDLLGQAVHNLLSNAIRYSQSTAGRKGQVAVTFSKGRKHYKIAVSDNGIGIPTESRSRVFERFYRAENAQSAEAEGTGLGLYLVKEIVEGSGGTISFKGKEGEGTTFEICIPLKGMSGR